MAGKKREKVNLFHYIVDDLLELRCVKDQRARGKISRKILEEEPEAQEVLEVEAYCLGRSLLIFPGDERIRPFKLHLITEKENQSYRLTPEENRTPSGGEGDNNGNNGTGYAGDTRVFFRSTWQEVPPARLRISLAIDSNSFTLRNYRPFRSALKRQGF